jgi:hypothetical protein
MEKEMKMFLKGDQCRTVAIDAEMYGRTDRTEYKTREERYDMCAEQATGGGKRRIMDHN